MYKNLEKGQTKAIVLIYLGYLFSIFIGILYVHFGPLLRSLFIPQESVYLEVFSSAIGLLTVVGGIAFGILADTRGRKFVIVASIAATAISAFVVAVLPTYGQIGVVASFLWILCSALYKTVYVGQSCASEIYLTELTPKPFKALAVATLDFARIIAPMFALIIGYALAKDHFGYWTTIPKNLKNLPLWWRLAFLIGTVAVFIGYKINSCLKETTEFSSAKKALLSNSSTCLEVQTSVNEIQNSTGSLLAFWSLGFIWSASNVLLWGLSTSILIKTFHYSSGSLIVHQLGVALIMLISYIGFATLSVKINPFKILKIKIYLFALSVTLIPLLAKNISHISTIFLLQTALGVLFSSNVPATANIYSSFPVLKRAKFGAIVKTFAGIPLGIGYLLLKYLPLNTQESLRTTHYWLLCLLTGLSLVCCALIAVANFERKERLCK